MARANCGWSARSFEAIPETLGAPDRPLDCIAASRRAALRRWPSSTSSGWRAIDGAEPTASSTRCPTTTCTSACWPSLFPQAAFIHCRRDLRDVAVSCWMTDFRSIRWANDPEHIAVAVPQYRRLMDHWRAVLPVPIHEVDYEQTVDDLEAWPGG